MGHLSINNNNKRSLLSRKANRVAPARSNRGALNIGDFGPKRISPPAEPPQIERSIKVTKRIAVITPEGSTDTTLDITPSLLSSGVPGGLTYWNNMRIENLHVWAKDGQDVALTVYPQAAWSQPPLSLVDSGTTGQRRAAVGFKLGLLDRARWFGTADTLVLATIAQSTSSSFVIHATIELMAPSL